MSEDDLTEEERAEILREAGIGSHRQSSGKQTVECDECGEEQAAGALCCQDCGAPLDQDQAWARPRKSRGGGLRRGVGGDGPPHKCRHCGGPLKKGKKAESEGSGCIIALLGLIFTPFCIGLPALVFGVHLILKREGFWRCKSCGAKFHREVGWFEF